MKNVIITIIGLVLIIICIVLVKISNVNIEMKEISNFNEQFEQYKGEKLYGTDVLTLINKAIDNNNKYGVERDKEGNFIDNNQKSVRIILTLLTTNSKGEILESVHPMEALEKRGLNDFISSFDKTSFECTDIEYNSLGRVSKIMLKQLEL